MTSVSGKAAVSVVVITHNEEKNIARCLESVQWADDIVVVDSGSSDNTCAVAERLGARVIHNDWPGFGRQKRFATAQARHDWVLSLDADEWAGSGLDEEISRLLTDGPKYDVYKIRRRHYFMGRLLRHGIAYPDDVLRLYNRHRANWNERPVHESVEHPGDAGFVAGEILHESAPSLARYIEKLNRYTTIQAGERLPASTPVWIFHLTLLPLWQFLRGYLFKLGFLDGIPGLVHNVIAAMNTFLRYAKLRELQDNKDVTRHG